MKALLVVATAVVGAVLLAVGLSATPDLRGWPSASDPSPTQHLRSTQPDRPSFSVSDCLSWTVDPNALPRSDEYDGTATETIVTCRSRSSFTQGLGIYTAGVVAAGLAWIIAARQRRRRHATGAP